MFFRCQKCLKKAIRNITKGIVPSKPVSSRIPVGIKPFSVGAEKKVAFERKYGSKETPNPIPQIGCAMKLFHENRIKGSLDSMNISQLKATSPVLKAFTANWEMLSKITPPEANSTSKNINDTSNRPSRAFEGDRFKCIRLNPRLNMTAKTARIAKLNKRANKPVLDALTYVSTRSPKLAKPDISLCLPGTNRNMQKV